MFDMSKPAQNKNHLLSRIKLNLLYPQSETQKLPVRFLTWLINYGRFIVIFVEILVVATFLARFKFDSDLADLKDEIKSNVPYLESLSSDEVLIKQTQSKIGFVKKTYQIAPNWTDFSLKFASLVPSGVKLTTFNWQHLETTSSLNFKLSASATTNNDLSAFMASLRDEPSFKNIQLTNITFDRGDIIFSVTGVYQ